MERREFTVDSEGTGERLDRWLASRVEDLSRSRLAALADEGRVAVDGRPARPALRLRAGQRVELAVPDPAPAEPQPEDLPLHVLHDDPDFLVVDKPAGMVVHPAAGVDSGTLVNALLHHVKDLGGIGGELRPGIVHRLDRDTSGAMVVAKNDFALVRLQEAFQSRTVEKRYTALVHGEPAASGVHDTPFGRHPVDRVRMTGRLRPGPGVRRAVTRWTVEERVGGGASRLDVRLETGRTHQIRVHFSEAGHPLLGDETYGGTRRDRRAPQAVREAAEALGRQALHARVLEFPHPRGGAIVHVEAALPPDFVRALEILRGTRPHVGASP